MIMHATLNAVPLVPNKEVQIQSFRTPIQLLDQSMTNQNNQQVLVLTNRNDRSVAAKFCDFVRMNPPKFSGSQIGKDPQMFIDEVEKIFGVMSVTRVIGEIDILQTQGCDLHMVHSVERQQT